jgi:hypothetical protein
LDFIAKRYGILPSELLAKGSSIDIHVAEVGIGYENYLINRDKNKSIGPTPARVTQQEAQDMWNRLKQDENERRSKKL